MKRFIILVIALVACFAWPAQAYLVGPAKTLDELAADSDVILKVTALKSEPIPEVEAEWYKPQPMSGFHPYATRFKVVSRLKGDDVPDEVVFRHYGPYRDDKGLVMMFMPQHYSFVPGRSYLLWADKAADGALRQLRPDHTMNEEQGALRTVDDAPVEGDIKSVVWDEVTRMLHSGDAVNVRYALRALGNMSGKATFSRKKADFPLEQIAREAIPFLAAPDAKTALAATNTINAVSAKLAEPELIAVANTHEQDAVRAAALSVLTGLKTSDVENTALARLADKSPAVQRAALLLLADFPGERTQSKWRAFATSPDSSLRAAAAQAIGRAQDGALAALLDKLIDDKSLPVREAATSSLLLLPAAQAATFWKKRRQHPDYMPVFTNALAAQDVKPFVADLTRIVQQKLRPNSGANVIITGQDPVYTSWHLLFAYLGKEPRAVLESPALKPVLEALESGNGWGSGEPEQLYRLYRAKEMEARARDFRRRMEAKLTYDIGYFFDRVDRELSRK